MQSILLCPDPFDTDAIIAELWERGTSGIIEEVQGLRAFFEDTIDLSPILALYPHIAVEIRHENSSESSNFSRQGWDPILVGRSFFIAPSWVDQPTPAGRLRLTMDGTNAFGSGRHESTQLVLEALEQYLKPDGIVLDIGCGSGILSQAAALLGATHIFSCDIHPDSIGSTRSQPRSAAFLGSADAIRSHIGDLVLVNISARVLEALASELRRIAKPGALLILAGFIRDDPPKGFTPEKVFDSGDWCCWLCRPEGIAAREQTIPLQPYSAQWW